jgi:hypothetical protein
MDMKTKSNSYLAIAICAILAACASPTPYQPKTADSRIGYSDEQIAQNRWRITYSGDTLTDRETVEDYLLFRSAQVTQAAGAQWFLFDTRDTKAKTTYYSDFDGFPYGPGWGWRRDWMWWPGDPMAGGDLRPSTRYQAYAEIITLTPEQAHTDPHALSAQDIVNRLGPKVMPPPAPPPAK